MAFLGKLGCHECSFIVGQLAKLVTPFTDVQVDLLCHPHDITVVLSDSSLEELSFESDYFETILPALELLVRGLQYDGQGPFSAFNPLLKLVKCTIHLINSCHEGVFFLGNVA